MGSAMQRFSLRRVFTLFVILGLFVPLLSLARPPVARAGSGSVVANVHLCDYDLTGLTIYQIAPLCGSQSNGNVVTLDNGSGVVLTQTTGADGLASFSIDPGISTFYLYTSGDPNHGGIMAGCKEEDSGGNDVTPYALMPIGGLGDVNFFFSAQTNMWYCDFFLYSPGVTPPPPTTYGTVTVNKITCPDGFDGYSADIYGLAQNCQDVSQVVMFTLTDSQGTATNAYTPGSGVNLASWSNVASGDLTIAEDPIDGYGEPRVFCKNTSLTLGDDAETEVTSANATITTELKNGYDGLYCDWFNISYDSTKVNITVLKYVCPDGFTGTDYSDLENGCPLSSDPFTFKLDGQSSGNPGTQDTGSVIANGVQWGNMDPDTWYIQEMSPDGYGEPIVYCSTTEVSSGTAGATDQQTVETRDDGFRISYAVDAGYNLNCDWFNRTGSTTGAINLHKYGCPANYDTSWTLNDFYQNCQTIVTGAQFTITGTGSYTDTQTLSGIDLSWDDLAAGDYTIAETQPSGWDGSRIFCADGDQTNGTGDYSEAQLSSGKLPVSVTAGKYVDCVWYNLPKIQPTISATIDPNAPATLTLTKFTCPEDYDPLKQGANPTDDCDGPTDGVTFSVVGKQNASVSGKTGDDGDGQVTFDGLKPGSYLLKEDYPDLTENAFIWSCQSDRRVFNYPFAPFAWIGATGTIKISLIAGETLECDWYNVPSPKPEGTPEASPSGDVDITFTVLHCANGQVPSTACPPADAGTGVSLTSTSGSANPIDFETDADGTAKGSVPADEYDVDADQSICFADSNAITADGTLDLSDGNPVDITIFICG